MNRLQKLMTLISYVNTVRAIWWVERNNWGDALNPFLISSLSCRKVVRCSVARARFTKYLCVGSICNQIDSKSIVWGAGCICENDTILEKPLKVYAVRGPLTRQLLLERGIDVPDVYGDPALLMPFLYDPPKQKQYKVGIVPHYMDKVHPWLSKVVDRDDALIIDVESGVFEFIDQVNKCEVIVSTSLHGVICADAYGIPSLWIKLSDGVYGNGFKFRDYMLSVGRSQMEPFIVDARTPFNGVVRHVESYTLTFSPTQLLLSCPFRNRQKWPDHLCVSLSLPS